MNLTMALRFFCALTVAGCATQGRLGALPTISDPKLAAEIIVIRDQRLAVHQSMMLDAKPGRRYYVRLQPIVGSGTVPLPVAPPQGEELLTKTARVE